MCKCTPEIRTLYCGKPGCEWPVHLFTSGYKPPDTLSAFKNFHRLLCERFGYAHDEQDWQRDQLSLIEHIAAQAEDAARYRHLRNQDIENGTFPRPGIFIGRTMPDEVLTHEDADAAVDAARAPAPPSPPFEYCDDPNCTREKGHEGAHCDIPF